MKLNNSSQLEIGDFKLVVHHFVVVKRSIKKVKYRLLDTTNKERPARETKACIINQFGLMLEMPLLFKIQ